MLAHLSHFNMSIKIDALNSLKEISNADSNFVMMEMGSLLENLCPLFIDRDYKVREAAILLFKTVISLPNLINKKDIMIPFYELINAHLSCAMTHVVDKIQYSSLKLLDVLIESMPNLIIQNPFNIFENFIDQISQVSINGRQMLRNDPCKLTSTQSWRYNVLNRLFTMFSLVFSKVDKKTQTILSNKDRLLLENSKSLIVDISIQNGAKCLIEINEKKFDESSLNV